MSEDNSQEWSIVLSGLKRFFDEGMVLWPKKKFDLLFLSEDFANSSYVLDRLRDLDDEGVICFIGNNDLYFKVLKF